MYFFEFYFSLTEDCNSPKKETETGIYKNHRNTYKNVRSVKWYNGDPTNFFDYQHPLWKKNLQ